jgi:hypothetical protein
MRLEPYLRRSPAWLHWRVNREDPPTALYNVAHGYYEFQLADLTSAGMLVDRVRHVVEKSWCDDNEVYALRRALVDTIGMRIHVEHRQPPGAVQGPDSILIVDRPRAYVQIEDAKMRHVMVPDVQHRLRIDLGWLLD